MAVLEMLPEVVRPEELLRVVALSKLVHLLEMHDSNLPILVCCYRHLVPARGGRRNAGPQEFISAIATGICLVGPGWRGVERRCIARERCARPRMAA